MTHARVKKEKFQELIIPITEKTVYQDSINKNSPHTKKTYKTFEYNHEKFYYEEDFCIFLPLLYNTKLTFTNFHDMKEGLSGKRTIKHKRLIFGEALIDVPVPSSFQTFVNELLKPFFVFQIFSIILWCTEEYYWYAIAIFVIMCVTLTVNIIYVQTNLKKIKEIATYICEVDVLRDGKRKTIISNELVPGDVVFVTKELVFPCDLILLNGFCLINEIMLTGEAQPVIKEALPNIENVYSKKEKLYTLSGGTKVVSTNEDSIAVVINTGFSTAKGELVRSILFPMPNRFKFERDSYIFVGFMGVMALIGFFIAIPPLQTGGYAGGDIAIKLLDLITIAIPPALPLTISIGIGYSLGRLKDKKISCIAPPSVNAAGRVSVVFFDKTGTLTKDEMSLKGVYDVKDSTEKEKLDSCSIELQKSLAGCHSLTLFDGELLGDTQEIAIIKALGWEASAGENGKILLTSPKGEFSISRRFAYHFAPELKRMGVVVECENETILYMKGAPEVIFPLCKEVPADIHSVFLNYTKQGYRVLACAYKPLESFSDEAKLFDIENGLCFLGLLLLENPIKKDAPKTIKCLLEANIHCAISTGDNILTGLAVGKALNLVTSTNVYLGDYIGGEIIWEDSEGIRLKSLPTEADDFEIVVTGNLLEKIITENVELLPVVKEKCKVYGRMSPNHKIMLIEVFQQEDTIVAMVGDGANDCGALKQADVGLSLSEAEASIAAPFCTLKLYKIKYILQEGRCALTTSLQCFKFMMMYSVIQFTCAICLYENQNNLTNNQFIYQDVFNVLPLTFTMAASKPYRKLSKKLPPGSLISVPIITSIIGQIIVAVGIIVTGIQALSSLSWYPDLDYDGNAMGAAIDSPAGTTMSNVIFMQGSAQLIIMCFAFSIGKPFRQPVYKNIAFCISCICLLAFNIYFIMARGDFPYYFLDEVDDGHMDYRWITLGIMFGGMALALTYERFGVPFVELLIRRCNSKNN